MEQNSGNFSMQDAARLMKTPAGQQLIEMIQKADSEKIKQAVAKFQAGDAEGAKQALGQLLNDPAARKLMEQMGK